jgi:hypothetical protein
MKNTKALRKKRRKQLTPAQCKGEGKGHSLDDLFQGSSLGVILLVHVIGLLHSPVIYTGLFVYIHLRDKKDKKSESEEG